MSSRGLRALATGAVLSVSMMASAWALRAPETPTIAEIAPKETLLIAGTDDWPKMTAALARSALGAMRNDPQFKALWTAMWDALDETDADDPGSLQKLFPIGGLMKDAGIEPDELPWPGGSVGIALFPLPDEPKKDAKDPKDRDPNNPADWDPPVQTPPGIMISSDFGAKAADVEAVAEKAMAQLVKRDEAASTTTEHAGTTIHSITLTKIEARWNESREAQAKKVEEAFRKRFKDNKDAPAPEWNPGDYIRRRPMPVQLRTVQTIHLARKDTLVIMSNQLEAVEHALDAIEGHRDGEIASRPSYVSARKALGDSVHGYAIALVDAYALRQAAERKAKEKAGQGGEMDDNSDLIPGGSDFMLAALGVKGTTALAGSVTFDTTAGTAELRMIHQIPKLGGLFSLLGKATAGVEPPAFAPVDAMSVGTTYLRFDKLIDTARETLKAMPPEARPIDEASIQQFEALAAPVLASMGPRVHILSTIDRPMTAGSTHSLYAIELRDPAPVRNILVAFGAQAGLKPRDFEGHQIFEAPEDIGPSVGLGFGYAFIGSARDVENAMRQAAHPASAIASRKDFQAAMSVLRPGGTAYIYQDLRATMEAAIWTIQHPPASMWDEDEDADPDAPKKPKTPEFGTPPAWAAKIPPIDTWMKYLGDTVWEIHQTDTGLEARQILLRPAADR